MATRMVADSPRRLGERPESWLQFNRASPMIDGLFAGYVFGSSLFVFVLTWLTPVMIALATPIYCVLRWERVVLVLQRCWPLLLLPILCITSAAWSEVPEASLRYGSFYLLTILPALFIGAGTNRMAALLGMFAIFAAFMFASVAFGRYVPWGVSNVAYAGLSGSKNMAGDVAGLALLLGTTTALWALGGRRWIVVAIAGIAMLAAAYCLYYARATGALVAAAMAVPCVVLWATSRRLPTPVRTTIFLVSAVLIAILALTSSLWMEPLFEMVVESSGKDEGLSGRDFLWDMADRLIAQNPLFGGGYRHFWVESNLNAQFVWRRMGVDTHYGFNFHNTPRDIMVDLGIVGLVVFTAVAVFCMARTMFKTMVEPHYLGVFLCALIVFESPRLFFELIAFQDMHYSSLLIYVIMAYGLRPDRLPAIRNG